MSTTLAALEAAIGAHLRPDERGEVVVAWALTAVTSNGDHQRVVHATNPGQTIATTLGLHELGSEHAREKVRNRS